MTKRRALDDLAGVELELEPGTGALVPEEGLERGGDVQRVGEVALELAVPLDPADDRGVETDAGVEEERSAVHETDTDPLGRAAPERPEELAGRVDGVRREAERARVHVRGAARQRCERRVGVEQTVGGLVQGSVTCEHDHDVEAVVRGRVREPGRVAAPRGLGDLDLVLGGQELADHDALAGRHRRRGGVDEEQDPHGPGG